MFYMVIYPCGQFYSLAVTAFDHGIIQNQCFYPFGSGKGAERTGHFCGQEQKEPYPVGGNIIKKKKISILEDCLAQYYNKIISERK